MSGVDLSLSLLHLGYLIVACDAGVYDLDQLPFLHKSQEAGGEHL